MGNTDAAARLAAGLVHPSIDAVDAAESQSAEAQRNLGPPGGSDAAAGSAALDNGAPQRRPALAHAVERPSAAIAERSGRNEKLTITVTNYNYITLPCQLARVRKRR